MASATRVVVIGGGIAGISVAAQLADSYDVVVVEQEFQPSYHSTGRSAAVLHLAFENDLVHRLTSMAEPFYRNPPTGFGQLAEEIVHIAFDTAENRDLVESFVADWIDRCPWLRLLDVGELRAHAPLLSEQFVVGSVDTRSLRLHVDAIVQGFRGLLNARNGKLVGSKRVIQIERLPSAWQVVFQDDESIEADMLINAAGAWADDVATLAGIPRLGLQPRRRTGVIVEPAVDCSEHPMCYRASGGIYFKPEGANLMVSPADATDSAPCDAQPEDIDVAVVLETLNECTTLNIQRPVSTWAGLRTFAADAQPVIGFDRADDQFFWLAALGGFGIQTAPAYAKIAASILKDNQLANLDLVSRDELSPARFAANT
ncbi:MAG: FAD-binding oxidoreductase [Gammaproteobacteria bacterium]|nr:FAD-binding oxidoreductase [Gammaproteobacteria bacterium]